MVVKVSIQPGLMERIMQSEIRQRKTNTIWSHLHVESTKQNQNTQKAMKMCFNEWITNSGMSIPWFSQKKKKKEWPVDNAITWVNLKKL